VSDPTAARTEREDFQATSDPGLLESADRGEANLLDYRELYLLWERQQWRTQDLDFSVDREHWRGFSPEERFMRMYGLSGFFIGEQRVTIELAPIMRAAPQEDMRMFLATQIADEARHMAFFDKFYSEVGVIEPSETLQDRLDHTSRHLSPDFSQIFDTLLHDRVNRLAVEPEDTETLVEAVTIYHMVTEGMLALTGQHFIIGYNEELGTLPGFVEGFTNVARDEHRHVAFGAYFLRDMARRDPKYVDAIQRTLAEVLPYADGVLTPPWASEVGEDEVMFGSSVRETREFAAKALERRLKVIGLATATAS